MEEWKVAKDFSRVKKVGLASFYQQEWDVCHKEITREFVYNWDEGTSSFRVLDQGFTLPREILLKVFQFKDETIIVFRKTLLCEILDICSLLIPTPQNSNGQ
jgi:hypothetical protein